jgi:hypothetical protein
MAAGFAAPLNTAVGNFPRAVALGDFNGDGKLDAVVTNSNDNTVSVLLGNGNGTFTPAPGSPLPTGGATPNGVVVGDFNGDGKLDFAVANQSSNTVSVFLGNGNGTFQAPRLTPVGFGPMGLAVADFNGDGHPDLAVTNTYGFNVTVLLGAGDGTFTPATFSPFPVSPFPQSVAVADFNGDGHPDLATARINFFFGNTIDVLLGNGSANFSNAPGSPIPVGPQPTFVAAGDFNGDGHPDLAVLLNNQVAILLGRGDGTFTPAPGSPISVPAASGSLALADFNGDGKLDLAVIASVGNGGVDVFLGNGDGTFTPQAGSPFTTGTNPGFVAAADVNGDGKPDLVTVNFSNTLSVLLNLNSSGGPVPHPGGGSASFIGKAYADLLGRTPELGATVYWGNLLDSGALSRAQFVAALEASPEFRINEVEGLYQKYLRRNADFGGLGLMVNFMNHGGTPEQVAMLLVSSQEYFITRGSSTNALWLNAIFEDGLGREIDTYTLTTFTGLMSSSMDRAQVAAVVFGSAEYSANLAEGLYQRYLRRPADPAGLLGMVHSLQSGMTDEQAIAILLASAEYSTRSGGV